MGEAIGLEEDTNAVNNGAVLSNNPTGICRIGFQYYRTVFFGDK